MAYDQSVRNLMTQSGYDNNKIGYDTNSGYVTYDNKPFMKPQVDNNGTTFTDLPTFNQAHQSFQNAQKQANPSANYSWMNSAEDSMDIPQRFAYYTSNPDKGQAELQRVNTKIGYLKGIAGYDPTAAQDLQSANQYRQNLMNVVGPLQPQQQAQQQQGPQLNDLISKVYQQVTNPQPYDVYNSPQYEAAKSASDYAAQQAIRQAQESMGQSGFGRSTNLADRAQLIQNDANQRLLSQVVPQIIQQHNELQQQQIGNLSGLISPLMQQQQNQFSNQMAVAGLTGNYNGQRTLQGEQADLANQQAIAGLTGQYNGSPTFAAQQAIAQLTGKFNGSPTFAAQQAQQQNAIARAQALGVVDNPQDAALLGVPVGTTTREMQALMNDMAYKQAELGIRSQANQIAAARVGNQADLNAARTNYYNAKSQPSQNVNKNDVEASYVGNIEQMTPENRVTFFKNEKANIVKDLGLPGYNALISQYNSDGTPVAPGTKPY